MGWLRGHRLQRHRTRPKIDHREGVIKGRNKTLLSGGARRFNDALLLRWKLWGVGGLAHFFVGIAPKRLSENYETALK